MEHLIANIPATANAKEAQEFLTKNPTIAPILHDLYDNAVRRNRVRALLKKKGYAQDVIDILIPIQKVGRPITTGPFTLLSEPVREAIGKRLGMMIEEVEWTPETASAAADAIVEYYPNVSSAAMALTKLRHELCTTLNIPQADLMKNEITTSTFRSYITEASNEKSEARFQERIAQGIEVPPPYTSIADLAARAREFIANPTATAQTAADLLVILSARPSEAETLTIGDHGYVKGVLKKKIADINKQYNIVSAIGPALAEQYLEKWNLLDRSSKRKAMLELTNLAHTWGLQRRDLRAIGAAMAVRAGQLDGQIHNVHQSRTIHKAALRHAVNPKKEAQTHYERVNDPLAELAAQIGELKIEDRQQFKDLLERLKRK